jgi:low affinity Fe/Cu permease
VPVSTTIRSIARRAPEVVGSPWAFVLSLLAVLVWLALGPAFDWSDAWLVLPATATSIFAFLIVELIQYTQNRDTRAIQLKLDELILDLGSRNDMVRLERLADEDLEQLERDFLRLVEKAKRAG